MFINIFMLKLLSDVSQCRALAGRSLSDVQGDIRSSVELQGTLDVFVVVSSYVREGKQRQKRGFRGRTEQRRLKALSLILCVQHM